MSAGGQPLAEDGYQLTSDGITVVWQGNGWNLWAYFRLRTGRHRDFRIQNSSLVWVPVEETGDSQSALALAVSIISGHAQRLGVTWSSPVFRVRHYTDLADEILDVVQRQAVNLGWPLEHDSPNS